MHYYSAESVIAELKANNTLICEGIGEMACLYPAPFLLRMEIGPAMEILLSVRNVAVEHVISVL